MGTFSSKLLTFNDKKVNILKSYEEFSEWYLECFKIDTSIFLESEVQGLLEDEKPERYPCIPLVSEDDFNVTYVGLDHVELWVQALLRLPFQSLANGLDITKPDSKPNDKHTS